MSEPAREAVSRVDNYRPTPAEARRSEALSWSLDNYRPTPSEARRSEALLSDGRRAEAALSQNLENNLTRPHDVSEPAVEAVSRSLDYRATTALDPRGAAEAPAVVSDGQQNEFALSQNLDNYRTLKMPHSQEFDAPPAAEDALPAYEAPTRRPPPPKPPQRLANAPQPAYDAPPQAVDNMPPARAAAGVTTAAEAHFRPLPTAEAHRPLPTEGQAWESLNTPPSPARPAAVYASTARAAAPTMRAADASTVRGAPLLRAADAPTQLALREDADLAPPRDGLDRDPTRADRPSAEVRSPARAAVNAPLVRATEDARTARGVTFAEDPTSEAESLSFMPPAPARAGDNRPSARRAVEPSAQAADNSPAQDADAEASRAVVPFHAGLTTAEEAEEMESSKWSLVRSSLKKVGPRTRVVAEESESEEEVALWQPVVSADWEHDDDLRCQDLLIIENIVIML